MEKAKLLPIFIVIHWMIALIIILNRFILEEGEWPHRYLGYACATFVILRILLNKKKNVSHYNPKAIFVYASIWIGILGMAITGFMMGLEQFHENHTLEEVHENIANFIIIMAILHLIGMFYDAYQNKRKTWMVMITGEKQ